MSAPTLTEGTATWPAFGSRRPARINRLALCSTLLTLTLAPRPAAQPVTELSSSSFALPATVFAVSDLDGDGFPDLVSSGNALGTTDIRLGQGDGSFVSHASLPLAARLLALGQLDSGNQDVDLITLGFDNLVTVHLGDGAGGFTSAGSVDLFGGPPGGSVLVSDLALADLDGDGLDDAAFAVGLPANQAMFLLSDGAGGLGAPSAVPISGVLQRSIDLADLDGDGDLDAVVGAGGTELTWVDNDGVGGFSVKAQLGDLVSPPVAGLIGLDLSTGDLDNDGDADVLFSQLGDNDLGVLLNGGASDFTLLPLQGVGAGPLSMQLTDLDADGSLDVLVSSSTEGRLMVVRGDGAGGLSTASTWALGSTQEPLALDDLDDDGDLDVLALDRTNGRLDVLLNLGPGAFHNLGGGILQPQDLPVVLTGSGPMTVGSTNQLEVVYQQADTTILVVGVTPLSAPFKGGVMVPQPDLLLAGQATGTPLSFVVPGSSPVGLDMWVQHWFPDVQGPAGWFASNGLRATVQ